MEVWWRQSSSPGHHPQGRVSETPYNHYSLLATIESVWHLGYLGHAGDRAGGVVPMLDLIR